MEYVREWITNIILFILLATVIDMLLPNSSMQKYTKMVTGLLLIAIILTPIYQFVSRDFQSMLASIPSLQVNGLKSTKSSLDSQKKEIQAQDQAYILEQMAVQLKKDAEEELMKQYGLEIDKIDISINGKGGQAFPDNLQKVSVLLKEPAKASQTVEAIQPVNINEDAPLPTNGSATETKKIAALLSKQWNISENAVLVSIEGRITNG